MADAGWAAPGNVYKVCHFWTPDGIKLCDPESNTKYDGPKVEPTVSQCCFACLRNYVDCMEAAALVGFFQAAAALKGWWEYPPPDTDAQRIKSKDDA